MDDYQDEVIREIDVFVTDSVPLYLLQFPLKPVYADTIDISGARFKQVHKKMELDIPFLVPDNYPRESLKELPKTQKFQSSAVAQDACLGTGIVKDNCMYISPIQSVLQLRPSFKNMQSFRSEITEQMEDDLPEGETVEGEGEALQQVTLKRKESEKAQSNRIQSFAYLKAQEEHEPWKELVVSNIGKRFISTDNPSALLFSHSVTLPRHDPFSRTYTCLKPLHSWNRVC